MEIYPRNNISDKLKSEYGEPVYSLKKISRKLSEFDLSNCGIGRLREYAQSRKILIDIKKKGLIPQENKTSDFEFIRESDIPEMLDELRINCSFKDLEGRL